MDIFLFVVMLFLSSIIILIYLVPSIIAYYRSKKDFKAILVLNLLGGLVVIGWVWALVWALMED